MCDGVYHGEYLNLLHSILFPSHYFKFCTVCIINLINILRQNNIDCRYGPHYMGFYGYADDISLSTVSGMLKTCETFAKHHDILFNALSFNARKLTTNHKTPATLVW